MDLTSLLPDSAMGWVNVTALAIACSSGVAAAIAKLTKNKTDDKIAAGLRKAHDLLGMVGLHGASLEQKRSIPSTVKSRDGLRDLPVRDHRSSK